MTKKKDVKKYVAVIEIKSVHSQLVPALKKGRSPKQVGQGRHKKSVRLHGVTLKELKKRIDLATSILETGKAPKGKKEETPAPPKRNVSKVEELRNYLNARGVKFHPQLGEAKLQALVDEHVGVVLDSPPISPGNSDKGTPPTKE